MIAISTIEIEKIIRDYNMGLPITRKNKIFYQNEIGTLRSDVAIIYTKEELSEYVKCASDVKYFIEKYFNIVLRDFQKSWIIPLLKVTMLDAIYY